MSFGGRDNEVYWGLVITTKYVLASDGVTTNYTNCMGRSTVAHFARKVRATDT